MFLIDQIRNFYGRFERPISSLSLVGGFVFDALTLKRVDTWWENLWILSHLIIVAIFIILIHATEKNPGDEKDPKKAQFWYVNILQFFFGGTLSVYLVFYFRSADIFVSWPFILLLALAFWANESFKRHYVRLSFQISLLYISIYSFAIFLVPVVLHKIGGWVFLLSGAVSLILIYIFILLLFYFSKDKFTNSKKFILPSIVGITIVINLLYFTNVIPPIPLSLKDGGVYHAVTKMKDGDYYVVFEEKGFFSRLKLYEDLHIQPGGEAYVYTAVFSPSGLDLDVVHNWQWWNEVERRWQSVSRVPLSLVGGREDGFRTFSKLRYLQPGKWRVAIETEGGQVIGSVRFKVIPQNRQYPLMGGFKR